MKNNTLSQICPCVIGISGISGAGKSTLIKQLSKTLNATTLFWDDFDAISQGPDDYVTWYESSRNYDEWVYDDLACTLEKLKKAQTVICPATQQKLLPTAYILFDAPLGYCHKATGTYIDFLVCLDTPLDIALARRLIKDFEKNLPSEKILQELKGYLSSSRPLFILTPEEKKCDLLLDGSLPVDEQFRKVIEVLGSAQNGTTLIKHKFQIIYINGPSSSGKSTLARALQQALDTPFLHIGIDRIIGMMPEKLNNWEGGYAPQGFSWKQSVDEAGHRIHEIQMGPFAKKISQALKEIVVTLVKMQHYVIIDDVAFGASDVDSWRKILQEYKVLWIGIKAPLPHLEEREKQRSNRIGGSARAQFFPVHNGVSYDLEFDTAKDPLETIVKAITTKIEL